MFWTRLGTCSSITSFPFSSFLFFFSSYGLSVLALYITYIELFSFFFFSLWFFYINHAIVTPLHPFGLLVSKKTIYIDVVDTRITFTRSLLFVSSFLFPFFSDPLLLYHLSSPFLSSLSLFLLLGLPVSFSVMLISSFPPHLSSLFLLVSFFFFVLCRHKSFVNVNITYVAGSSPSLYLSLSFSLLSSLTIATTTALFNLHLPPPLAFSLLTFPLPFLSLYISFSLHSQPS